MIQQSMAPGGARLILASGSPRRHELLLQIGVPHRVRVADVDEQPRAAEDADACAVRLAVAKACALTDTLPVLGADTIVVQDGAMLGKPRDRADALAMLQRLSGRTHRVISAVALAWSGRVESRVSVSTVRFRQIDDAECAAYWESAEPRDKAGAYAIQGLGAVFIEHLEGSYSGVMGLPLFETAGLLTMAGIRCLQGVQG